MPRFTSPAVPRNRDDVHENRPQPTGAGQARAPRPASFAFNDVNGLALPGADLVEHSLTSDPELASGLVEFEIPSGNVRDEPRADLIGDRDPPRRVRCGLLGGLPAFRAQGGCRHL